MLADTNRVSIAPWALLAALATLVGCHAPITQLIVVVDSDLGTEVASVELEVEGASPSTLSVEIPARATFPFSFGVQRADSATRVMLRASARDAAGAVLVRRVADVPFVIGETRRVVIHLERSCVGVYAACGAGQTCRRARCETQSVDEVELQPAVPGEELLELPPIASVDASMPVDAGPRDAGPTCAPACGADETCGPDGECHCGAGPSCGPSARCDAGSCQPWPRSCDGLLPGRGCDVVSITGGSFTMGDRDGLQEGRTGAIPLQPNISVGAFRMDAYEVTIARFRRFWSAGHPEPSAPVPYPGGASITFSGAIAEPGLDGGLMLCDWTATPGARELHPINCVNWSTALAFCAWDGGRLPTEAEFEYVARHREVAGLPSPRTYPWGETAPSGLSSDGLPCDQAHAFDCAGEDGSGTLRVGSFAPTGGLYDLAGNAFELLGDRYQFYQFMGDPPSPACWEATARANPLCTMGAEVAIRGGSVYATNPRGLRGAARGSFVFDDTSDGVGFRCAYP